MSSSTGFGRHDTTHTSSQPERHDSQEDRLATVVRPSAKSQPAPPRQCRPRGGWSLMWRGWRCVIIIAFTRQFHSHLFFRLALDFGFQLYGSELAWFTDLMWLEFVVQFPLVILVRLFQSEEFMCQFEFIAWLAWYTFWGKYIVFDEDKWLNRCALKIR